MVRKFQCFQASQESGRGTLGPCRAVCLCAGFVSCWGSASRPYGSFSCRFCGFQEGAFSMASYRSFRGSKGTLGPCRAVCLWRVGLESCWGSAVSHPYGSFSCRFCGFQEGAFSMASYRSFRGSKGTLGPCRAVCLWRVGLESCWGSAVSHPYGSFSCRFCGFQEGAFSMASYRSFRGSKGTLGPCRAVCLWRVGLESCWGSAVSHPVRFWKLFPLSAATIGHPLGWNPAFCAFAFRVLPFESVSSSICFQPSVRELFVPILWLPRRCVFDGFLQEF